ncbi:hypothetical protein [Ornithinibacillus californiensis]|uniref:hypothetical protein n=1 Tax=Ornithinibacillus californiensis TaxID=161536 RepID=UPI00064D9CA2|nr:hypothetical protein [Ornithinibacillus californiensis]
MKKYSLVLLLIGGFLFLGYVFYHNNFTDEGILENVIERDGYILERKNDKETVKLYIKPEWIPFNDTKEHDLDIELARENNTGIILDEVWNREIDIYFSFDTTYDLNFTRGSFMYNGIFNEDGTYTTNSSYWDYSIYNLNNEKVDFGQSGQGPNSTFGFAIEPENYDLIRDGFYVEYSGFYLYEYNKK